MDIKVLKKDGSIENFDQNKIARVTKAAGLTAEQAQTLASKIAQWVRAQREPRITTFQIRNKVIEELGKVNKYAANLFTWYEKTKKHHASPQNPHEA